MIHPARRSPVAVRLVLLTAACIAGTAALGWWAVPVIGAAWGLVGRGTARPILTVATAALLAWAVLLIWSALSGPVASLAATLGAIAGVPGAVFVILTLALPFGLAGCAAAVTGGWTARRVDG